MWDKFERKEIEGRDVNAEIARALAEDVQSFLLQPIDPEALEQKARTLSNSKRGALPQTRSRTPGSGSWISQHIWNGSVKTSQGQLQSYSNEENPPDCTLKGFEHDGNWALFVWDPGRMNPQKVSKYTQIEAPYQGVKDKEKVKEVQPLGAGAEAKGRERGARAISDGFHTRHDLSDDHIV